MTKLLRITQLGNPILRKKASRIKDLSSKDLKNLIDSLNKTVKKVDGVGIAAPQVGVSKRLFIMSSNPNTRYPKAPIMKPTAIINPVILARSKKQEKDWEGCLSIPGIRALVPRHTSIKVEYTNENNKKITKIFKDFPARIFQHEYDHLEGIVFLDRVKTTRDIITEEEYQKLIS